MQEFPSDAVNEVIFQENGMTIRSVPAVHGLDGAVGFILECFLPAVLPVLAVDYMVFNVTKDDIRVRMSAIDEGSSRSTTRSTRSTRRTTSHSSRATPPPHKATPRH